jgi:hypothetical protein
LSLESHNPEALPDGGLLGKKKDPRDNKKFQEFLLATDADVSAENSKRGEIKRIQT